MITSRLIVFSMRMEWIARSLLRVIFFTCFLCTVSNTVTNNSVKINEESLFDSHNKGGPLPVNGDHMLLISTLDGQLSALDVRNGKMLWSLQERPILKMSKSEERGALFLASPIDGSLFTFRLGSEGLKKLPFTIPDLVSASPSRGEDGALYTGHKKDSWISVDLHTGNKHHLLDSDGIHEICPSSTPSTIFIGRTEYSVNLFDKNSRKIIWNATFTHYTSHLSLDASTFGVKYFASSSDGFLVAMDTETGGITWTQQFDSPVVGIYSVSNDGAFISCPFRSVALETLEHLSQNGLVGSEWADKFSLAERFRDSFLPTLYVGRHGPSSYALFSFVDANLVNVMPKNFGRPLLEGPQSSSEASASKDDCEMPVNGASTRQKPREMFLIGHHQVPDYPDKMHLFRQPMGMLEDKSSSKNDEIMKNVVRNTSTVGESASVFVGRLGRKDSEFRAFELIEKFFYAALLTAIVALLVVLVLQNKQFIHQTNNTKQEVNLITTAEDLDDDSFKIGKITYRNKDILGSGSQGTIVFKGRFEGREVAVKRVLTEFIDIARREIDLLQVSDRHRNVVRYFCTERDRQFFYIALELCPSTLHDLVSENKVDNESTLKDIIGQMLAGIDHLHSLNIVHRDIKPHNVLLSCVDDKDEFLVKISDFGLCRRIPQDHSYYSKSGSEGTVGWIAPEVVDKQCLKASKAVDIFSLGLVIFYVLSRGGHPFGESAMRQVNIVDGNHDMRPLRRHLDSTTARDVIQKMIARDPSLRPTVESVRKHPAFWSNEKALKFLESVSDRVEKLQSSDELISKLNVWPNSVIKKDWTKCVHQDLFSDMKKFRSYTGTSIKDLIRFIRNKRHHYHELSQELRSEVGTLPDGFMSYFIKRFPGLILHTYNAMQSLRDEAAFSNFY